MSVGSVNFGTTPYPVKKEPRKEESVVAGTLFSAAISPIVAMTVDGFFEEGRRIFDTNPNPIPTKPFINSWKSCGKVAAAGAAFYLAYRGIKALFKNPDIQN